MCLLWYLVAFRHFAQFEVLHHLFDVICRTLKERSQPGLHNLGS